MRIIFFTEKLARYISQLPFRIVAADGKRGRRREK